MISSRVNPRIFKCRFKSLTDKVTNSSSEIPQLILDGDRGRVSRLFCIIFELKSCVAGSSKSLSTLNGFCHKMHRHDEIFDFIITKLSSKEILFSLFETQQSRQITFEKKEFMKHEKNISV